MRSRDSTLMANRSTARLSRRTKPESDAHASSSRPNALVALKSIAPSLTNAERRAADFIVSNPKAAIHMSITQLAAAANVGESTVVRLSMRLGYRGFPAFKIAIAQDGDHLEPSLSSNVTARDPVDVIVRKVLAAELRDLDETAKLVDVGALQAVIRLLGSAKHILAYGAGPSSFLALDFAQKLARIGLPASGYADPHLAIAGAALIGKNDVAVAFSYSGRTKDSIQFLGQARKRGATTVAVTSAVRSPLTLEAKHTLATSSNEGTFRTGATSSRTAQLFVVDVVFVALAASRYGPTMKALSDTFAALSDHRV